MISKWTKRMEKVLDAEIKEKPERSFFKWTYFLNFVKIESVLLIYLVYLRIQLIQNYFDLGDLRGLVCYIDFESGWTFLCVIMILYVNLQISKLDLNPALFLAKLGPLLALPFITNFMYWTLNTMVVLLVIYYFKRSLYEKFKISQNQIVFYAVLVVIWAFLIGYLDSEYVVLKYY